MAALGAEVAGIVLVALLVFGGGHGYRVKVRFQLDDGVFPRLGRGEAPIRRRPRGDEGRAPATP
jgi:hypothetical protein